jgi:hypothetical protein
MCVCADKSPKGLIYNIYVCSQYVHIYYYMIYYYYYYELLCRNYAKPPCPILIHLMPWKDPCRLESFHHTENISHHISTQIAKLRPMTFTTFGSTSTIWFFAYLAIAVREARRKWACRALATKLGHISKIWSSSPNCRPVIDTHILC